MPLSKRFLFDAALYGPPDLFEESQPDTVLRDTAMSATIGAIHQLSYLSLYAVEVQTYVWQLQLVFLTCSECIDLR